ncbi:hypothetical protein V2S66_03425 [Streptomyces sp. V4-01]|uniref:Arc-like DNA binding domain-containing protein n=1 Tax=Actinacidiphila polyblastidii TaxID=3110430 RepID=A0ABU7P5E3_9ACTN|nr:hypothetical protein [Streptomyces sp. V4-01]
MARPATGQTPVKTFRPPEPLWKEVTDIATAEGRKNSDAVIEALHYWVKKKRRERTAAKPTPPQSEAGA